MLGFPFQRNRAHDEGWNSERFVVVREKKKKKNDCWFLCIDLLLARMQKLCSLKKNVEIKKNRTLYQNYIFRSLLTHAGDSKTKAELVKLLWSRNENKTRIGSLIEVLLAVGRSLVPFEKNKR